MSEEIFAEEEKKKKFCPFHQSDDAAFCDGEGCELWLEEAEMCCLKFASVMIANALTPMDVMATLMEHKGVESQPKSEIDQELDIMNKVLRSAQKKDEK